MKNRLFWHGWRLSHSKRHSLAWMEAYHDARHAIRQGVRDCGRRGQTNREGKNNRRMRKYLAESKERRRWVLTWPDDLLP